MRTDIPNGRLVTVGDSSSEIFRCAMCNSEFAVSSERMKWWREESEGVKLDNGSKLQFPKRCVTCRRKPMASRPKVWERILSTASELEKLASESSPILGLVSNLRRIASEIKERADKNRRRYGKGRAKENRKKLAVDDLQEEKVQEKEMVVI